MITPETRRTIELWWLTHPLSDQGWTKLLNPEPCQHQNITALYWNKWCCENCKKVGSYEDFRPNL
jgi:hypothetical protein